MSWRIEFKGFFDRNLFFYFLVQYLYCSIEIHSDLELDLVYSGLLINKLFGKGRSWLNVAGATAYFAQQQTITKFFKFIFRNSFIQKMSEEKKRSIK